MTRSEQTSPVSDRSAMIGPSLRTLVGRIRTEIKNRQKRWSVAPVATDTILGEGFVGPALDFLRFRSMEEAMGWINDQSQFDPFGVTKYIPVHLDTHQEEW